MEVFKSFGRTLSSPQDYDPLNSSKRAANCRVTNNIIYILDSTKSYKIRKPNPHPFPFFPPKSTTLKKSTLFSPLFFLLPPIEFRNVQRTHQNIHLRLHNLVHPPLQPDPAERTDDRVNEGGEEGVACAMSEEVWEGG